MGTQPLAPARSALLAVCLLLAAAHLASAQSRVLVSQCVDIPSPINQQLCTVLNQDQCLDLSVNATLGSRVLISKAFSIADVAKSEQELTCQAIQGSSACKTCLSLTNVLVNHTIGALKGCLALQVKCLGATITSKKLGCFDVDNCSVPACPNGCSQHGSCTSTGCACNANYFGPDCSISAHNGCFSVGSMPETCINFQQENCTDMDVQVTVGGIKVVDRSLSLTDLANGLQLCADGDTLPCSPCFSIDEFSAGDGRYSACASSSVQCAGVQVGSFPVGCLSGNLSANCVPDVCPGGCSGHGSCSQLTCTCDAGYQGPDCSVYVNDKCVTIDGEIVCYAAQASCDGGLQIVASGDAEHVFQFAAADIGTPQCFDAFEDCSYCVTMTEFAAGLFDAAATTSLSLVCSGFTLNLPAQSYVAEQPASCFSATACATSMKDVTMRPGSPYSRIIARGTALNVLVKLQPKVADVTFTVTSDVPGMQAYSRAGCPASPGNYLHVRTVNQDPVSLWVSDCTTAKTIQGGSFYATLYCPMNVACLGSNSATCGSCNVSATAIVTVISPIGSAATASVDMGQQHFLSTGPLKEGDTFKVRVKVSSATEEQPAPPVLVGNNVCPTTDSFTYEFDFAANTEVDFELKGPCDDYLVALSGPAKGSITYEYARGAAASSKGTTVLIVLGCAVLAAAAAAFVYFKFMRKQNPGFVPLAMSEEEAAANDSVN